MIHRIKTPRTRFTHADPQDFCAIFMEDMGALYSLALLLTVDYEVAEQCFLAAADDCLNGAEVFPERARSWSRRAVVKQAIFVVSPKPDEMASISGPAYEQTGDDLCARLLQLPVFERFVFAMSVLERYSMQECAALLSCSARDVERARVRALHFIGRADRDSRQTAFTHSSGSEPAVTANVGAA